MTDTTTTIDLAYADPVARPALPRSLRPENSPFIIGLATHAELPPAHLPELIGSITRFLDDMRAQLPDTELRIVLDAGNLASLAVARTALARGLVIDALIAAADAEPMPEAFDHPRVRRIEVPGGAPALAEVLVRRSSLLLALWDGHSSTAPDDTADQVFRFMGARGEQRARSNRVEVRTVADDLDVTPRLVYWLSAGGSAHEPPERAARGYYLLAAGDNVLDVQPGMPASLKRRLADLNQYNLDSERVSAKGTLERSASLIGNDPVLKSLSNAAQLSNIDRQYMKADALAGYMQRRSDRLFNLFGIMTFTMGLAYLVYDKITENKVLLMLYMLVLLASLLSYYFFQSKRWLGKYLSYRALAETLRVRFYWAVAGVDRSSHSRELIALTGLHRFPGFGWINFALDSIEPTTFAAEEGGESYEARRRLVEQAWIGEQARYFARKVASMEQHRYWIGRLKSGVFVAALIVLAIMFMFSGSLHHVDARTGLSLKNMLTFCSGALAVVLGVWELRQNKMAVQELLWQYRNQLRQFQHARLLLERISGRARRDEILEELGENSLMEVYLWAIHRYHREHAPPAAP